MRFRKSRCSVTLCLGFVWLVTSGNPGRADEIQPFAEILIEETRPDESDAIEDAGAGAPGEDSPATDPESGPGDVGVTGPDSTIEDGGPAGSRFLAAEIQDEIGPDPTDPSSEVVSVPLTPEALILAPPGCPFKKMTKALKVHGKAATGSKRIHVSEAHLAPGGLIFDFVSQEFGLLRADGNSVNRGDPVHPRELAVSTVGTLTIKKSFWWSLARWIINLVSNFVPFMQANLLIMKIGGIAINLTREQAALLALKYTSASFGKRTIGQGCLVMESACQWNSKKSRLQWDPGVLGQYMIAAGQTMPQSRQEAQYLFDKAFDTLRTRSGVRFKVTVHSPETGRPIGYWGGQEIGETTLVAGLFYLNGRPIAIQTTANGVFKKYLDGWLASPTFVDAVDDGIPDPMPAGPGGSGSDDGRNKSVAEVTIEAPTD